MKKWESHLTTARENLEIAKKIYHLNNSDFFYWITVILFYSAFHFLSALLFNKGITPPGRHKDMEREGGSTSKGMNTLSGEHLGGLEIHYMRLYNYSWHARYVAQPQRSQKMVDICFKSCKKIATFVKKEIDKI